MAAAAFGIIMTVAAVIQIVSTVSIAGINAGKQICVIQDKTKTLKENTDKLKEQYDELLRKTDITSQEIDNFNEQQLEEIKRNIITIDLLKTQYRNNLKSIQIYGIIFICIIFLLLLLKQFNLLEPLGNIFLWPFQQIINLFRTKTGKNKK